VEASVGGKQLVSESHNRRTFISRGRFMPISFKPGRAHSQMAAGLAGLRRFAFPAQAGGRRLAIALAASSLLGACAMSPSRAPVAASRLDAVQAAGVLRICTPGDYKPFSFQKPDAGYEGIDIDLMDAFGKSLAAKPEYVKTTWANLLPDLSAGKCDIAVGGVSVTTDRQKKAFFSAPYMVNGKTPIARCADVAKYQTVADIDKPTTRVIFNPGGSNERFARANFKQAHRIGGSDHAAKTEAGAARSIRTSRCSTARWAGCCRATTWHSRRTWTSGCTWRRRVGSFRR
jgi:hypothetical protein